MCVISNEFEQQAQLTEESKALDQQPCSTISIRGSPASTIINSSASTSIPYPISDSFCSSLVKPGFLELCAGSAILSYTAEQAGFLPIPMDYDRNKFNPKVPVIKLNLANQDTVRICKDLISMGNVRVVTAAVPCGTASRAREISIPRGPKPLRSEQFPYGLPSLSGTDLVRVNTANAIYFNAIDILKFAHAQECICILENPDRSYLFCLEETNHLLEIGFFDVRFQHCRWTPSKPMRAKWTRLRVNHDCLRVLDGPCSQQHEHLGWGRKDDGTFYSAGEAAYPAEMCEAIVSSIKSELVRQGFNISGTEPRTLLEVPAHKRRRLAGKQPRGNKLPGLISEFKEVIQTDRRSAIIKGAKVLRGTAITHHLGEGGENTRDGFDSDGMATEVLLQALDRGTLQPGESLNDVVVAGIFREPSEFVKCAMELQHPSTMQGGLPDVLLHAVYDTLSQGAEFTALSRLESGRKLISLAASCMQTNSEIFKGMDPSCAKVLRGKNLALAQALIDKWSYPDTHLVADTIKGFSLTSFLPFTGIFDFEITVPSLSEGSLRSTSELHNTAMLSKCSSSGSQELDAKFWEQTLAEKSEHWLSGPFYSVEEVKCKLGGHLPHLTRRFPLEQSTKVRSIDDYLESNLNCLFGTHDKLVLHDTDTLASLIKLIESLVSKQCSTVQFGGDISKELKLHPDWTQRTESQRPWFGKTKDLSQAYKQLPVAADNRWASVIVVWDPITKGPAMFIQNSLPFGSSSSVLNFNRWARFIWYIGIREFSLLWTNFYDDYPTISPDNLRSSTGLAMDILFKALGWRVADGAKDVDWAQSFTALGVVFDISGLHLRQSSVGNKPGRTEDVVKQLSKFVAESWANTKDVESIRGKLVFMDSQIFGRAGKSAMSCLQRGRGHGKKFNTEDKSKIRWLIQWLQCVKPRVLSPPTSDLPLLLFTDGACEQFDDEETRITTCGAVLFDRKNNTASMFGMEINKSLQREWSQLAGNKKQLVTEAELLPVLISRRLWKDRISGNLIIVFVDSNPAKYGLIRGMADTKPCEGIIRAVSIMDAKEKTWPWYSRVPSKSNPADGPSRLQFPDKLLDFTVCICTAPQPTSLKDGVWVD